MDARPANDGQLWTRDELILALELYCRIPFQRTKATDSRVKELAAILHRTPASVARKLGNFGAFDPQLAARNIAGLTHASKLDKATWDEFHTDWSELVVRAHDLRRELAPLKAGFEPLTAPSGPSEKIATVKQRLHQAFFRDAVISSYNARCCVTGLPLVECLVAGHIVPWSVDENRRADPTNGVCMSATFDRLFDCGLVTIEDDLTLRVSERICKLKDQAVIDLVAARHGQKMIPPTRFYPDPVCLRWHRENRFHAA
ncbi:MAG: HNH endonuclease [Phycisphaerales bacterium]|nr:HNH endonuclease [Phycisphaerales bacterium]